MKFMNHFVFFTLKVDFDLFYPLTYYLYYGYWLLVVAVKQWQEQLVTICYTMDSLLAVTLTTLSWSSFVSLLHSLVIFFISKLKLAILLPSFW